MFGLPRRFIQTSIAILLALWVPSFAHADEIWTVVAKKSHFGPGLNTLVIKRAGGPLVYESGKTTSGAGSGFLVISGGNVYLAVDEQMPVSPGAMIKTESAHWPGKKLIQIGLGLFRVYCYRCFLYSDDVWAEITLQFLATSVDPRISYRPQGPTAVFIESSADKTAGRGRPLPGEVQREATVLEGKS